MGRGRSRVKTNVTGLEEVLRKIGAEGAAKLINEVDEVVERVTLEMINEAKDEAPIDTGRLKNSIHLYGRQKKLSRVFGSDLEYATRQEYEHSTKKGFFRKAIWNNRTQLRDDVREVIKRHDS
jgi:hypothetical protein